jgi:protein TonB
MATIIAALALSAATLQTTPPRTTNPYPVPLPPAPPAPPAPIAEPATGAIPRANLSDYISDADYPASALRAREQGIVGFRLIVAADGRVANCTITATSGSWALDSATCRILRSRARFTPARDRNGYPAMDIIDDRVTWVLPVNGQE